MPENMSKNDAPTFTTQEKKGKHTGLRRSSQWGSRIARENGRLESPVGGRENVSRKKESIVLNAAVRTNEMRLIMGFITGLSNKFTKVIGEPFL